MFEDPIPPVIRLGLTDAFEGWEIVEFLGFTSLQVLEAFEDEIADKLSLCREALGIEEDETETDHG